MPCLREQLVFSVSVVYAVNVNLAASHSLITSTKFIKAFPDYPPVIMDLVPYTNGGLGFPCISILAHISQSGRGLMATLHPPNFIGNLTYKAWLLSLPPTKRQY